MKKRLLSILLILSIMLTVFPTYALASGANGAIQGTVVDVETQGPIEVTVSLYARGSTDSALATTTSDASTGAYSLAPSGGVSAGQYTLVFKSNLYLTRSLDVEVTSNDGLIIAAATGLYPVGKCDGTVTDKTTGAALSGVTVNVYQTSGDLNTSATTGANGKYSIETQAGVYNLEFVKSGYTTAKLERVSLGAIGTTHDAQMVADSGGNGDIGNWTWSFVNGVLTISGTGKMNDYNLNTRFPPWSGYMVYHIIIEDGITSIGNNAFSSLSWMTDVIIPDSVTSIGDDAFSRCNSLTSIVIPDSITDIGEGAFEMCYSLTDVTLSNQMTHIKDYTFEDCSKLSNIIIPDSITCIGFGSFWNCSSLTNIIIPSSVISIDSSAFNGCQGLINISVDPRNSEYASNDGVLFNKNESVLIQYPAKKQGSYAIPNSVISIESCAFEYCANLTNISIPDGVTTIKYRTFADCSGLTSIIIPNSVTTIDIYAFSNCTSLTDIYYSGDKAEWDEISVDYVFNTGLNQATIHYNSTGPDIDPSEEIIIRSDNNFTIYTDGTSILLASIPNAENLQKGDISWSSSNELVAVIESSDTLISGSTASATAVIRGVSAGTATITVTLSDGRSASCQVNVSAEPNTIQFSYISSLPINTSQSLSAKIKLNTIVAGDEIVWTSSDSSILAFDTNGAASVSHPIPTIPTDSVATDTVTLYGRGTGKVKVTCRMPASGVEKSVEVLVFKDASGAFKTLYKKFEDAYSEYIQKVASALKEKQNKVPQLTIDQQAEELMRLDSGNAKLVTFMGTYGNDAAIRKNVYKAAAQYLAEVTNTFDLENIKVNKPDEISITLSIINAIIDGIDVERHVYKFGNNVTVELRDGISASGAHFRNIYYKKGRSESVHVATLLSKPSQIQNCINEYVKQLLKLEKNLVKKAYEEVRDEFKKLGFKGLKGMTRDAIASKLGPYTRVFEQTGAGKVTTAVSACADYYHFIEQVLSIADQDPLSLLSDYDMIKKLSFEPTSVDEKVMGASVQGLENAGNLVWKAFDQLIETGEVNINELLKGWAKDTFTGVVNQIMCPVNVSVYDSTGTQVGYVGEDDLWYNDDVVYIEKPGEAKTIYSHDGDLRFEIVGTDDGTLNCTFEEFTDGAAVSRVNYYNIPLYEGKAVTASLLSKTVTTKTAIITDETGQIEADESISGSEYNNATVTISCSPSPANGGEILGAGSFVRGDMVSLQAVAESGYEFIGWQDANGDLLSADDYYEFTAQDNLDLVAIFSEDVPDPVLYAIAFDATGGSVTPNVLATKANGTLSDIPTPTRAGFTFNGWYTAYNGGIKISKDTVFSENTTVYAQWINKGSVGGDTPSFPGGSGSGGGSSNTSNSGSHSITTPTSVPGGKVTISPESAKKGDTVTITATPDNGYELDYIKVTDKNGVEVHLTERGNGKHIFTMPDSNVTLDYAFKPIEVAPPIQPAISFTDVSPDKYYYDAVAWAVAKGITNGTSATTFSPNGPCTRGQIVTFLWRAAGSPSVNGSNPFTDVKPGDYWYDAVLWAVSEGITDGTSATTFSPNDICTRGQAVTFLYRNAGSPATANSTAFMDVTPDAYYSSAVAWALANSITNGTTATTFSPKDQCTRGQIVTFLYRSLEK